uniref:Uncharacterized protein n=1 Tax=Tanacetum cinerariifolium TaxID=118510 RepID=A0A6L2P7S1_TANCI|nr:hypothetical protein [Tanacetum cinerariifolium]
MSILKFADTYNMVSFECTHTKPKRKNTQVPQPSGSIEHVVNEAVYKELDDRLVRAAITASSLEAEQDIGNIYKTQSKATTDEASSPGTTLGGGPRFQDTIGIQLLKLEVFVEKQVTNKEVNDEVQKVVEEVVEDTNATKLIVDAAQTLKPKAKGIVLEEPSESITTTISSKKSQHKGKGIMVKEPMKFRKKDQIRLDEEDALKLQAELQAEFDKEERIAREKAQKEQEANIALIEE